MGLKINFLVTRETTGIIGEMGRGNIKTPQEGTNGGYNLTKKNGSALYQ